MGNNNLISSKKTYYISIAILAGMFFIFGFVSWVNAILIPYFRISCELTHFESYFVAFAFYIAYFVMAIPSGVLLKKVGFKRCIMYGFMLTALGAFLFVPAALARQFEIFLAGLFSIGTGLAILQTAANPYVTIIGPIDSAAKRISIMGICNKFAGIVSPLIFAALILNVTDKELFATIESGTLDIVTKNAMLDELIQRVIVPYAVLGVILLLTGIGIRYSTWEECRRMVADGHEICNHSWSHPNLTAIDRHTLLLEIRKNDSIIKAETGVNPTSILYPFNATTPQVRAVCEEEKVGARIEQFGLGQRNSGCEQQDGHRA